MGTANEELLNALVRHQIYLLRLSSTLRNRVQKLLDDTEQDLRGKILARLENTTGKLSSPTETRRLETLLGIVRNLRTKAWDQIDLVWAEELGNLAAAEPDLMQRMVATVSPVLTETVLPGSGRLRSIVSSRPFEGHTMQEWAAKIRSDDLRRIDSSIRVGYLQGETPTQIAGRVVGTARLRGVDGITEITRRQATAITRTAVNFVASEARAEWIAENEDLVQEEQFVATLDSRTTPVCRANDGHRYPLGKGPRPPLHYQCRSLRVPVLDGDAMGDRPAKPSTERMLLREFAERNKLDKVPGERSALPRGTKGAFDDFSRRRVRELTGQVPAKTTYQEWLTAQSAEFQNDVLGPTRAKLFRDGGLPLEKFVDHSGEQLNLSLLASKEAAAFRAAGLDPHDF